MIRRSRLLLELAVLVAALAALAAAAYAAQHFLLHRPVAAPEVGKSMDDALGPLILKQVELSQPVLKDPVADKAFAAIMDRLRPGLRSLAPDAPNVRIVVLDSAEVNAFALPGGIVCVYAGLIRDVDSAEQMAGILAHELSHVAHRDPLALLARQVGMAAIVGFLTGGQGGNLAETLAETLVNVHYGREAEDRADEFAVELLARSNIRPSVFADGLERISKAEAKNASLLRWIDTHSPIDERISRAREQAAHFTVKARKIGISWKRVVGSLPKRDGSSD